MRLVDAEDLRYFLIRAGKFLKGQDDDRSAAHAIGKIIEHLDMMPSIETEPIKRGEWVPFDVTMGVFACTACYNSLSMPTIDGKPIYKICPYCGAKMEDNMGDNMGDNT